MRKDSGFTLVELMITIAVAAVLLGVGIPSMADLIEKNRQSAVINHLVMDIRKARAESYARNQRAVICRGNGNATAPACSAGINEWTQGWVAFIDTAEDGDFDTGADELLGFAAAPPNGIHLYSNQGLLSFRRFSSDANNTFQVCTGDDTSDAKAIILFRGRPRLASTYDNGASLDCQ